MKILAWGTLAARAARRGFPPQPMMATPCADLANLHLPHVTITEASAVTAATPYCKVLGSAKPTADSDIHFEVVIPDGKAWNGRYLQVGNGGFAGAVPERAMLAPLAQGYAVAGTDDGHEDTVNTDA